jgi:hypothetical protein
MLYFGDLEAQDENFRLYWIIADDEILVAMGTVLVMVFFLRGIQ